MDLLIEVERHLKDSGTSAARFGRVVMNDASFVRDMRRGRDPRTATKARVRAWLARQREALR